MLSPSAISSSGVGCVSSDGFGGASGIHENVNCGNNDNDKNNNNQQNSKRQFSSSESEDIQANLTRPLDVDNVQFRSNGTGGNVAYLEGWRAINLANEIFGFNGWSSEILQIKTEFSETDSNGRHTVGVSCRVRISLRDGTFHDDIGYGSGENQRSKATCYDKAYKESVTDAMKRALRLFGNRLGNCTYDKQFIKNLRAPRPSYVTDYAANQQPKHQSPGPAPAPAPVGQWGSNGNQAKIAKKSPPKFVVPQSTTAPLQKKTSPLLECVATAFTTEEEIVFEDLSQLEESVTSITTPPPQQKQQPQQQQQQPKIVGLNKSLAYDITSDPTVVMTGIGGGVGAAGQSSSMRGYKFGGHNHHGFSHHVTMPLDQLYNNNTNNINNTNNHHHHSTNKK